MYEPLARKDVERLRAAGHILTDEEVIRLNELATLIYRGKDTTAANHPRFAFAGNAVLHEPTVGALEWWWSYGHDSHSSMRGQLLAYCFMLAFSRDLETLNALTSPKSIARAVKEWAGGIAATEGELLRAMLHVRYGEIEPVDDGGRDADADEQLDRAERLVAMAAGSTGIEPKKLRTETETTLMAMIAASVKAGEPIKRSTAKVYMAYQRLIRDIEGRGKRDGA